MIKKISIFLVIILITATGLVAYKTVQQQGVVSQIAYIKQHYSGTGKLIDFQNDLNVKDISSFKWFNGNDNVEIHYGGITLKMTKKKFLEKEMQDLLGTVFITYKEGKDGKPGKLYYMDQEIEKWVK